VALSIRWQEMLNVYLSTLINNIVPLGFTADQHGLIAYNHHFTGLMSNNANPQTDELKEMHKNVRIYTHTHADRPGRPALAYIHIDVAADVAG
jgi:hypothetical protein